MDADANSLVTGKVCPSCGVKYSPEMDRCPVDNSLLAVVRRDPFIGKLIADKYKMVEILGSGGFSTVYKAEQQGLRREVAIKILHAEFVDQAEKIRRFQQEAESISTLVHTNVAAVYDYGVLMEGQPYLAMELVQGTTLAAVIAQSKTLPADRAVVIFLQACEGIAAAHATGLIHRDLKPSNIMLDTAEDGSDHVKILDFGLAKVISDDGAAREHLTMTGEILGTPAYMAPEQCMGAAMDRRTDVYSFGCVMYETLSGHLPVEGDNSYEMMNKHINEVPLSLSKVGVPVPPKLVRIVNKAMQKDPDDRYQDFAELKDALQGVEPALTKEFKDLIFSGSQTKLSKKKRSLKKKILLSAWTILLVAIAVIGVVEAFKAAVNHDKEIAEQFAKKITSVDCGILKFNYPAIFLQTNANDYSVTFRLMHRILKSDFIDFKQLGGKRTASEWAENQRLRHQQYKHFVEVIPAQKFDFGKDKDIHGVVTEFCSDQFHGFTRERHVYFGEPPAVVKLKLSGEETQNSNFQEFCNTVLNSIEYFPELKFVAPTQ